MIGRPRAAGSNADKAAREELTRWRRELQEECGEALERVERFALEHYFLRVHQTKTVDLILPRDLTPAENLVADWRLRELGATPKTTTWSDARTLRVRIQDVLQITHVDHAGLDE